MHLRNSEIQWLLPTAALVPGRCTMMRSAFLCALRAAHGVPEWKHVHVFRDGEECRCCQCGGPRSYSSAKRCGQCVRDNALCRKLRPGRLGQVIAALLEGESRGYFRQTPTGWMSAQFRASLAEELAYGADAMEPGTRIIWTKGMAPNQQELRAIYIEKRKGKTCRVQVDGSPYVTETTDNRVRVDGTPIASTVTI